jgi:cell division protein FtsB
MRRVKVRKRTNFFIKAVVFTFIVFCTVTIISQQIQLNDLSVSQMALHSKITDTKEQIDGLKEDIARPFDEEYIKKIARAKLNYHMPEEIIFYNDLIR